MLIEPVVELGAGADVRIEPKPSWCEGVNKEAEWEDEAALPLPHSIVDVSSILLVATDPFDVGRRNKACSRPEF